VTPLSQARNALARRRHTLSAVRSVVRAHPGLGAFTVTYLVAFLGYGLAIGSRVAVPCVVVIAVLIVLVCRLENRFELLAGAVVAAIWLVRTTP
jgi:hypothetical protein